VSVYQKLNNAREKFHALKLTKTGHNKFAGYYYFELGDFLVPALKVFREEGLCAVVSFASEFACMTIYDVEKPDQNIALYSPMGSAQLKGCHEVQNIGAVETYQRRYLWVAALEIVEHDALDATTGTSDGNAATKTAPKAKSGVAADVLATNSQPLTAVELRYLDELASEVQALFADNGAAEAFHHIEKDKLDDIQKIYLATKLPSAVRNQIKAFSHDYHAKQRTPA
jgi:hypothetical protein